jgi:hypothetical protein
MFNPVGRSASLGEVEIVCTYNKRALFAWTLLAAVLVFVCYFFTPPAGAHPANPNIPININYLYGFNDQQFRKKFFVSFLFRHTYNW